MVLFAKCSVVFHLQNKTKVKDILSLNNCYHLFRKGLPDLLAIFFFFFFFFFFAAVSSHLSAFPFDVENLMWI